MGVTKLQVDQLFAERFATLSAGKGRIGCIIPTAVATAAGGQFLFRNFAKRAAVASLYDFENQGKRFFDMHASYKFCLLSMAGHELREPIARYAFFLLDTADLDDVNRVFTLGPDALALINPNTGTLPIFRTRRDADLTTAIYGRIPVLWNETENNGNRWTMTFKNLFDMTDDSDLFRTRSQLENAGWRLRGNTFIREEDRMLPLCEAKMAHHFDHRWNSFYGTGNDDRRRFTLSEKRNPAAEAEPRYWIADEGPIRSRRNGRDVKIPGVSEILADLGWEHEWLCGWRDVCRATDERTAISAFIPRSGVGNKFHLMFPEVSSHMMAGLIATQSSLVFDFVSKQKVGSIAMGLFIWKQLPVPTPEMLKPHLPFLVPRVLELVYTAYGMTPLARDLGDEGAPFVWDDDRRALLRAELDAFFFRLYGIDDRDDVDYILETFQTETGGLKHNEIRDRGEYRTKRLVLAFYDRMHSAEAADRPYETPSSSPPLATLPATRPVCHSRYLHALADIIPSHARRKEMTAWGIAGQPCTTQELLVSAHQAWEASWMGEPSLVNELPHDLFAVGSIVSLRADPSRTGAIIAELPAIGGRRRFNVYHSPTRSRIYFEDQLQPLARSGGDEWAEALAAGQFVDPVEFRAGLTATRLNNPQTDHLYSLRSARIQFIPFQFKPILRLLRADRPRLLVADDVGVGKTIEAGLILKELSTRQNLQRVLVLCPKALTTKWRAEMRRFDEDFRILSADTLRYCLDEADMEGEWPEEYSRSIVHYELFRMSSYLIGTEGRRRHRGLLELDPSPQFDLVIADEAHHLRTPGTGGHQLIERLCLTAEAVLMLSATPVQVHRDNLYTLLHLLRPELFQDKQVFEDVMEPNRFLTSATKMLRAGPSSREDWLAAAAAAVQEAADTTWGNKVLRSDRRFQEVVARLSGDNLDDEGRVRSIRDLEELHSLAHVMNRTRRRDIGRFTIREPRTVSVPFTLEQRRVYDSVLAFREKVLLQKHDPLVVRLILDTLERQAESSINALSATVDNVLTSGDLSISDVTDDPEAEDPGGIVPDEVVAAARDFVAAAASLPAQDPKFDQLHEIVSMTMEDSEGPGKILVFSYFLNTISYLHQRLARSGVRTGVVTGRNSDEDREDLRRRFRLDRGDPDAIDVLLSSEVGCEGLDYEFCDRLVNYDIPWNPMRIEQRIGRIDRFGQRSDKVLIFNFITPDTVAERVFYRCFERLGVFQDSVGDLEDVLGEITQDLNRLALDPSLSPEQVAERTRQISDNAIRRVEEQRRLDEESGSLLGLDDAFTDEVEEVVSGGRFVDESDLHCLIDTFLKQPQIRGSLVKDASSLVYRLRVSEHTQRELTSRVQEAGRPGRFTTSFVRALETPGDIPLTFDQQSAAQRRELEFITPVHPLARAATAYWVASDTKLVSALQVKSDLVPPGRYAFTCEVWETLAVRPDLRLVCLAVDTQSGKVATDLSRVFLSLLPATYPLDTEHTDISGDALAESFSDLDAVSDAQRRELIRGLAETNEVLVSRKLASLQSFHDGRVRRLQGDLREASDPRIIRMRKSELARVDDDFARRKSALEAARQVDVISERVAAGIIEVVRG